MVVSVQPRKAPCNDTTLKDNGKREPGGKCEIGDDFGYGCPSVA
jgi:hypothetical protein